MSKNCYKLRLMIMIKKAMDIMNLSQSRIDKIKVITLYIAIFQVCVMAQKLFKKQWVDLRSMVSIGPRKINTGFKPAKKFFLQDSICATRLFSDLYTVKSILNKVV